jgi:YbbR domain-containing protein
MSLVERVGHNLGLKALSLLLAVVLWLFIAADRETERSVSVPVMVGNVPPSLSLAVKPPSTIDVRIKGPRMLVMKSVAEGPQLLLDLKGSREGTISFPSPGALINLPEGVRVTRVVPASMEVRLVRRGM